jgi:hypothetical protein
MDYQKIRNNPKQFESLTSLKVPEFDFLLRHFRRQWIKFFRYRTTTGKRRKIRNNYPERDTRTLPSVEDKLFFLLVYLKTYTIQEFQGASFNLSQSGVSKWVKVLKPILRKALKKIGALPSRDAEAVQRILEEFGGQHYNQDATERPVERSVDNQTQKAFYSGKKKAIR